MRSNGFESLRCDNAAASWQPIFSAIRAFKNARGPSSGESAWGRAGSPSSGTNEHQKRFRDEADFNGSPGGDVKLLV
jgi:hypothetical protein